MTNNISILTTILLVIVAIMVTLLAVLAIIYIKMKLNDKKSDEPIGKAQNGNTYQKKETTQLKQYTVDSVFNFMEFDKVEDDMIIQKNGKRFLMVIECQGINYDLMSEEEKVAVEEGFSQFLNTLKEPVQLYIQTRKINLESSLNNYQKEVEKIEKEYNRQKLRYEQLSKNPNTQEETLRKEYYEYIKQKNLYEYGKDIIYNTEKMSLNKNILNEKYYVITSYYADSMELGNLDKEEIKDRAFSELYTKAKAIIRALSVSGVTGKILSSIELADLLYVAYNRDESDSYGIEKAQAAGFDELYLTAQDYMDKKMKLLDDEIEKKAYIKANQKVIEAQSEKAKKYKEKKANMDEIINNLAELYIQQNMEMLGKDIANNATEKIEKEKKEKEAIKDVQKKQKITRRISN